MLAEELGRKKESVLPLNDEAQMCVATQRNH